MIYYLKVIDVSRKDIIKLGQNFSDFVFGAQLSSHCREEGRNVANVGFLQVQTSTIAMGATK